MEAGADYIAPYFNRMENMGVDPDDVISSFAEMIALYDYKTQILGASFKNAGSGRPCIPCRCTDCNPGSFYSVRYIKTAIYPEGCRRF